MRLPCRQCRRLGSLSLAIVLLFSLCPTCTLADQALLQVPVTGASFGDGRDPSGHIRSLDVVGDYAYLGIGPRLVIIDVSDPTNPLEVGRSEVWRNVETGEPEPHAEIRDIVVVDETAYLAVASPGRSISLGRIDVQDPTDPRTLHGLAIGGHSPDFANPDALHLCWTGEQMIIGCTDGTTASRYASLIAITLTQGTPVIAATHTRPGVGLADLSSSDGDLYVLELQECPDCREPDEYLKWEVLPLPLEPDSEPVSRGLLLPPVGTFSAALRVLQVPFGTVVTTRDRLYVLDLRSAQHEWDPSSVPSCDLPGYHPTDAVMASQGDYAVVITRMGLVTVDLRDLDQPAILGRASLGGAHLDVEGDHAYIVGNDMLQIVDISDSTDPQLVGSCAPSVEGPAGGVEVEMAWQLGGAITALDVVGDYAYLGIGPRLVIIDVSDPANPVEVGRSEVLPNVETGEPEPYAQIYDVVSFDGVVYIAALVREGGVVVSSLNVSEPTHSYVVDSLAPEGGSGLDVSPTPGEWIQLCWTGDQLILARTSDSFSYSSTVLYGIEADQGSLNLLSVWGPGDHPPPPWHKYNVVSDMQATDGMVYVLGYNDYWPESCWEGYVLGDEPSCSSYGCLPFSGQHRQGGRRLLYSSSGMALTTNSRLHCIDLEATEQPSDPDLVPHCELSADDTVDATMMPSGDHGVVISESELLTVDLRNAGQPSVSGRTPVGGARVDADGDYAYVLDDNSLRIVDLSDPTNPQLAGAWRQVDWSAVSHVEVLSEERMLVSAGNELLAIETAAGAAPTILGALDVGVPIYDFCLLEDEWSDLLLATDGLGLLPVDICTDGTPVLDLTARPELCEADYVDVAQTSWLEDSEGVEPRTVRRALALTDDQELVILGSVYGQTCDQSGTHVCEGFDVDQVSGRYAYVGRSVRQGPWDYTGQIEVYDLSNASPRVAAVVPTEWPVESIVAYDDLLFASGVADASGGGTSSSLRAYGLSEPLAPARISASLFGECQTSQVGSVSPDFMAAKTICAYCGSGQNWWGTYCGSSLTLFRVSAELDLQYVYEMDCLRGTAPVALSGNRLLTVDPVCGLVAWQLTDLPAWGLFIEGEACPPCSTEGYSSPNPTLDQTFGSDFHTSGCGYVLGQLTSHQVLPHDGDYFLWARLRETEPSDGTFSAYTSVDMYDMRGGRQIHFDGASTDGTWAWKRVAEFDDACYADCEDQYGTRGFCLGFDLFLNHPSAAIDCLYLTDSPDALPPEITHCVPAGLALLPMIVR